MRARTFDWEAIHRRVAAASAAISGASEHDADQTRRVLEQRARAAAQRPAASDDAEALEVLGFTLVGERYAVETCHVREVCQLRELTPLPCTPPFVAGVMSLRGEILAIIDLRKLFSLPGGGLTELNRVIVLSDGKSALGLLADSVDGVRALLVSELQPGLPNSTGNAEPFFRGVTSHMLAVLDGAQMLTDAALMVNEQVKK